MSFKLKKTDTERLMKHRDNLNTAFAEVEAAVTAYNVQLNLAKGFVEDLASSMRGDFDDKSEAWQEGERGEAVDEFITTFESFVQDHDDLTIEDPGTAEALNDLEHEVNS
jgi:hypothetical protein